MLASAIQLLTGYFTETNRKPVRDIGESSRTGAATVILSGVSIGMESAVYAALLIGGAVFGGFLLGTGNATIALFAVAMAGIGLLTTVGVIVSMDSFGPVTDNAQGIAEMSGDVEGEGAQILTNLDAIGNTTKAITKGIAIATAVLAATALFGSFRTTVVQALGKAGGSFSLSVDHPNVLVGLILGAAVVFMFSSLLIMAVGRAAQRVVLEVRNQFRTHPGIMDYTEKPEYGRVVDICTRDSLRELVTPGLLAVLTPIAIGFGLGYAPLGSFLAGAIATGVLMAVFLANSGGAWDNAKKLVEDGNYGGKGSEAHEATIIGDTVGDPFKDTAGPAINPLLKVMNLVSLLIATSVVKYSSNVGLRTGVALGAVIIIVAAIVISKRREAGLDDSSGARRQGHDGWRDRGGDHPGARTGSGHRPVGVRCARRRGAPGGHQWSRCFREGCAGPGRLTGFSRQPGRACAITARPAPWRCGRGRAASGPGGPGFGVVAGFHLIAGQAQQVQHRIQVGKAQRRIGGVPDHRLGVESDAQPGQRDHVQIVRAVTDRHGLAQRHAGAFREAPQRVRLPGTADDRPAQPAGQLPGRDVQHVRGHVVDAQLGGQRVDDLRETAADDPAPVAEPLERPDQGPGPRGQPQLVPDVGEHVFAEPGQQRHPLPQGRLEVQLTAHGRRGDLRHLRGAPGPPGEQIDDLILDEGRIDVHHDQPHGPPPQATLLYRHIHLLLGRLAGQFGAQRGRVGAGHFHLDARHRALREPGDPVDVGPVRGDTAGDGGDGAGRQRAAEQ